MMIVLLVIVTLLSASCGSEPCKKSGQYCYCDQKCPSYGDCCQGHPDSSAIGTLRPVLTCKRFSRYLKMWIVDRCPERAHRLSNLCTKAETLANNPAKSFINVVTEDDDLYENAFCAECNGKTKYRFVNVTVDCFGRRPKGLQEINSLLKSGTKCTFTPKIAKRLRLCDYLFEGSCPTDYIRNGSNKKISEGCEKEDSTTVEERTDGKKIFRNADCCTCWPWSCLSDFRFLEGYSGFSYLLNFNEWMDDETTTTNTTAVGPRRNRTLATVADHVVLYSSIIFTLFSIFALVVLVVVYSSNSMFHNFGGYLTICLCGCLLLWHVLTLILTSKTLTTSFFCWILGIFQHYIALSNFVWMAIYGLDLLQTFGLRTTSRSKKKSISRFFLYFSVSFGLVAVIVGSAVVTEFTVDKGSPLRPKYGGENCWFTSKIGGIIWYFVPVCILLSWNFGACITVFYKLSKTAKECRVVQQKESNKTMWLCLRLTAVFGIGYVVQIVAVLTGVGGLIDVGSMLNCLQGCFLVVCFMWPKRVRSVVSTTFSSMIATKSSSSNAGDERQSTKCTRVSKDVENLHGLNAKNES